ncbi:response regulator [Leptolyngbya boryana CZ1]|uniref:Response regulator n=1 Tax=Leptolyngbya boryana CZ1 TaxID=3060204 RepID=A0AA96WSD0_LEPBY|nr:MULTISPECIES: response regulator [Leptolyngbya]MBN8564732.1 response regulator [Leptolyngbya sp. UWPOB_LEPTO1]WNZ43349.1 response regulator [Leptolyngbya boryana CZ1]
MKTILVIEDETQIRDNIAEILELAEFDVITAADGHIGLELAKSHRPDLIICDVMMPELDGFGVLENLRQSPYTATIPLIFLTARVERSDQRQGMNLGADDYLTKPFEPDELLTTIESRLKRQETVAERVTREQRKTRKLRYNLQQHQQKLEVTQKQEEINAELLHKLIQNLRDPVSNINLAIQMMETVDPQTAIDRYLKILKVECDREVKLLDEIEQLQALLTPETTRLLQQYKLISP